jgi:ABC-type ATPase involved in cell division
MYLFEALNQQGTTILIATHDTQLLEQFNHPILGLHDGTIRGLEALEVQES